MSVRPNDLVFFAGGECLERYGVLVKRTSPAEDVAETFTRASTGAYVAKGGVAKSAAQDIPRVSYTGSLFDTPGLLLEGAGTNLCLQSENFGTTWTAVGTPTRSAAAHTASGITLDLIGDDDAASAEGYYMPITFTGNALKTVSVDMKQGASTPASGSSFQLVDTTVPANRLVVTIAWSGGVPTVTASVGTYLGYQLRADGVYRFLFVTATTVIAANTNRVYVYPCVVNAETGNVYVGAVQAEDSLFPTSYKKTTTVAVVRSADAFSTAFLMPPQAMTLYAKFVDAGNARSTGQPGVLGIGGTTPPCLHIYGDGAGHYDVAHGNGVIGLYAASAAATAFGDTVELRAVVASTGAVSLGQAINGGAEVVSAVTAAITFASAWTTSVLWLGALDASATYKGFASFRSVKIARGNYSLAEMQEAF